jgi:predicted ATPase
MIQNLKLENFKCFDQLDLHLEPLTLITGVNGMGKSSVIQSLLLLRQSFDERYLQTEDKVLLTGELVNLVSGNSIRYATSESPIVGVSVDYKEAEFNCSIKSDSKLNLLSCTSEGVKDLSALSLFNDNFLYLSAERLGPRLEYPKAQNIKHKGRLGLGSGELTAAFLFSCLRNNTQMPIEALKHPEQKSSLIYANVSAWLSEIIYDGAQITASEKSTEKLELIYSFNKGKLKGYDFSPLNVGFGFSYLLPVIIGLLSAKSDSLILIENPEAHLHPAAQSKIGKLIALAAENGVQVLIETHSDHLLNGIRVMTKGDPKWGKIQSEKTQIHYFTSDTIEENELRYKISFKIKDDGGIERWPKGFFDEWDNNLDDLLS